MKLLPQPKVNDLVEGIIREHALVFLAGEEGSGKSITAMNLALAVWQQVWIIFWAIE